MSATELFARRATLSRSVRLLSEFRFEQTRSGPVLHRARRGHRRDGRRPVAGDSSASPPPAGPCSTSAADPAISRRPSRTPGFDYIGVEPDPAEMHAGPATGGTATYVRASGMALPFADASVDICLSSNVAEHVPEPWRLAREMLRVTRPGGLVVLSYTVWLGPVRRPRDGVEPLPRRRPRRRALRPQARPSAEEQLRIVTVRGFRRGRPRLRRRAPARWSPHSPATTRDGPGG